MGSFAFPSFSLYKNTHKYKKKMLTHQLFICIMLKGQQAKEQIYD